MNRNVENLRIVAKFAVQDGKKIPDCASLIEAQPATHSENTSSALRLFIGSLLRSDFEKRQGFLAAPALRHPQGSPDRKSTRLNSSHVSISYAVFCLKKKIHMCEMMLDV